MSPSQRRVSGVIVAAAMIALAASYLVWRLGETGRRGWAGMTYIAAFPKSAELGGFSAGSIVALYPGGPAERAGLRRGDRILSIDAIPLAKLEEMGKLAARVGNGHVFTYRIARGGKQFEVRVPLRSPLTSTIFVGMLSITVIVALVFIVTGVFVFWRRPDDTRAKVFLAVTIIALLSFTSGSMVQVETQFRGIQGPPSLWPDLASLMLVLLASLFFAPLLLHLALIFPKDRPVVARRPALFRWIYGVPIYAAVCMIAFVILESLAYVPETPWMTWLERIAGYATLTLALISLTALLVVTRKSSSAKDAVMARPFLTLNGLLGTVISAVWLCAVAMRAAGQSTGAIMVVTIITIVLLTFSFAVYPVSTIVALYRSYRESGPEERRQVKWPLWGTIVAAGSKIVLSLTATIIGLLTMLGRVEIPTVVGLLPEALSKMLYVVVPLSFAFAILKYRLMNIDVIIRRTVLYTILSAVVFVLYGVLVAGAGTLLIRFARVQNTTMVIASTIVVALVAVPLRNRLQQMVDRNLFRERRDYPLALRNIGNAIGGGDIDAFLRYAAEQLQHALQTRFVAIALRSEGHFVISAKVGIADELVGRLRIPAGFKEPIPQELRRLGAVISAPVSVHREPLGLVVAGSKLSDQELTDDDREFLAAAASQIALGIENSRLRTEEAEFAQARAIQQVLLPINFPRLDGFEITGRAQPARSVGGDYFDALALGDGKVAVCIGDVAGKGMPAALLMANLQAAVKATAGPNVSPSRLCENVKRVVGDNLTGGKFISFFYGVIDSAARTLTFTNAGHNPPILVRADGAIERLAAGGPTFCRLFRDDPHQEGTVALAPGDRLVLFTDGASEARRGEEEFGEDRLAAFIASHRGASAAALQERIVEELTAFTAGSFSDDVTLVVVAPTVILPPASCTITSSRSFSCSLPAA